jgi:chorismate synthase
MNIRILSAGKSHGKYINIIIDGLPAGIAIDENFIKSELKDRRKNFGRSKRQTFETDEYEIISGVKNGITNGSPIGILVENKDFAERNDEILNPRPGHADLYGSLKYDVPIREILERASARESVAKVIAGAIFKLFLKNFKVKFYSFTYGIKGYEKLQDYNILNEKQKNFLKTSLVGALNEKNEKIIKDEIKKAEELKDSLGGIARIIIENVILGLGSHSQYDTKIEGEIAKQVCSIPSVKGIMFGNPDYFLNYGSKYHDEIYFENTSFRHKTNNSGGITGGITTGEHIYFNIYVKPVPTLSKPLNTVNIKTKEPAKAFKERADVWVLPAVGKIAEAMSALVIADFYLKKFGTDNLNDILKNFENYKKRMER